MENRTKDTNPSSPSYPKLQKLSSQYLMPHELSMNEALYPFPLRKDKLFLQFTVDIGLDIISVFNPSKKAIIYQCSACKILQIKREESYPTIKQMDTIKASATCNLYTFELLLGGKDYFILGLFVLRTEEEEFEFLIRSSDMIVNIESNNVSSNFRFTQEMFNKRVFTLPLKNYFLTVEGEEKGECQLYIHQVKDFGFKDFNLESYDSFEDIKKSTEQSQKIKKSQLVHEKFRIDFTNSGESFEFFPILLEAFNCHQLPDRHLNILMVTNNSVIKVKWCKDSKQVLQKQSVKTTELAWAIGEEIFDSVRTIKKEEEKIKEEASLKITQAEVNQAFFNQAKDSLVMSLKLKGVDHFNKEFDAAEVLIVKKLFDWKKNDNEVISEVLNARETNPFHNLPQMQNLPVKHPCKYKHMLVWRLGNRNRTIIYEELDIESFNFNQSIFYGFAQQRNHTDDSTEDQEAINASLAQNEDLILDEDEIKNGFPYIKYGLNALTLQTFIIAHNSCRTTTIFNSEEISILDIDDQTNRPILYELGNTMSFKCDPVENTKLDSYFISFKPRKCFPELIEHSSQILKGQKLYLQVDQHFHHYLFTVDSKQKI